MNSRQKLFWSVLCVTIVGLWVGAAPRVAAAPRNVLILISDNHTWFDVGCYGNKVVQTPNIDRLASRGVRFTHAFATTASCGPSRAVMYTGLLTHANGQYAHPHREHNQGIRPDVPTVFEMLKTKGYRTGLIGKDHIKPLERYPIDYKPRVNSRDVVKTAELAAEFFSHDEDSGGGAPFFLIVSYHDPHPIGLEGVAWGVSSSTPGHDAPTYDPARIKPPAFLPDRPSVREEIAGYYEQISRMDYGVGLVLDALRKSGHDDDTLVIFYSDHGTSQPGAMGTHYEPGVRVPFVARVPGAEKTGVASSAMVAFTDITPTVLDWAEVDFKPERFHGRSFLPVLKDPADPDAWGGGWNTVLLSHVAHDIFAFYPMRTLREKRFKLIWNVNYHDEYPLPIDTVSRRLWVTLRREGAKRLGARSIEKYLHRPQLELYDLQNDPWEVENLANDPAHRARLERMVSEMVKRLKAQGDPWLRNYHPFKAGQ
ncbi:MAG: sulfatase family protein [Planctomycetota bacterium]